MTETSKKTQAQEIVRFLIVGAIGAGSSAAIYTGLVMLGLHYVAASLTAWCFGVFLGYGLNRRFTFGATTDVSRSFVRVVAVYVGQQVIGLGGIALLVEGLGLGAIIAYFIMAPIGIAVSFVAMKFFAFR